MAHFDFSSVRIRFQPVRPHKKTSFTIINELSPNQSRPPSPTGGRTSPFRGKGFRANSSVRHMRPVSCPDSPRNSMVASSQDVQSQDDSAVPSKPSVHFNIIAPVPRKRTAVKVLQSSVDDGATARADQFEPAVMDVSYQDRDMESFEIFSNEQMRSGNSSRHASIRAIYPEVPRVSLKPSPAPRRHIHKSLNNLDDEMSTDNELMLSAPVVNPRSYHKGLLRVVSSSGGGGSASVSPSKIPRRKSSVSISSGSFGGPFQSTGRRDSVISASMGHLPQRRGQSVSPNRKKSVDLGGSMIDLGMTPARSSSRISKPTTLSPIIGTPNKDCQQDDEAASSSKGSATTDQSSPTKIPVRRNSNVNLNSRLSSRSTSREPSPQKSGSSSKSSPTKIPLKSHAKSSPSKASSTKSKKSIGNDKSAGKSKGTGTSATAKEASSARKEPAITRERSSVKKPPAAAFKREPSTLKRQPSNLKREASTLKRTPSNLKRETSNLAGNKKMAQSTLHKNQSDSSLTKRIDKSNSFKQKRRTSSESDGLNEIDTANTSDTLIPLNTSNAVSKTTAAIASQPVQITAAVTNQLNKTNSTSQIVNNNNSNSNDNSNLISDSGNDVNGNLNRISSSSNLSVANNATTMSGIDVGGTVISGVASAVGTPSSDAQKAHEQKQMTGDAEKSADDAMAMEKMEPAAVGNGETMSTTDTPGPLLKKASTRTLGAKSDIGSMSGLSVAHDAVPVLSDAGGGGGGPANVNSSSAIETNVNVIEMTGSGHNNDNNTSGSDAETMLRPPNDIDERQSERAAISVGPDVEVDGMNVSNRSTNKLGQDNNGIGAHINPSTGVQDEM